MGLWYTGSVRLTELCLQGYKSFAGRQRFAFPSPITAIIGPNGSGKSNIAEAIRWALGEQRAGQLRARRGEELIFAGSERRARAGLAEVTLVLDNGDGALPIDSAEVAVTRRIHRDGTAEVMVNGARVRLRDLTDLFGARLGDAQYTVVGQGTVDNALSLSPVERRALIDDAAGIGPLQRKRDRALRQLAEAQDNLARVDDLLAELGPQLRRMSRLGERARRHEARSSDLGSLLATWYGYHWHQARTLVVELRDGLTAADEACHSAHEAIAKCADEVAAARLAAEQGEAAIAEARREYDRAHEGLVAARGQQAVATTRIEALERQLRETESDIVALTGEVDGLAEQLRTLEAQTAEAEAAHTAQVAAEGEARAALAHAEAQLRRLAREMEAARQRAFEAATQAAHQRNEKRRLEEMERAVLRDKDELQAEAERLADRRRQAHTDVTVHRQGLAKREAELAAVQAAAERLDEELTATAAALATARAALAEARGQRDALTAHVQSLQDLARRLDPAMPLLAELTTALVSPSDGGAAILGRVAALLQIESGWEKAVVAALGNELSGLVLADAIIVDGALAHLPAEVAGPVALVPAHGLGAPWPPWQPQPGEQPAKEVVRCPTHAPLVEQLLGHTAFVADLAAARRAVARDDGPLQAAVIDGTLVLRGGVVLAGTPGEHLLAVERDLRFLPAQIESAMAAMDRCAAEIDDLVESQRHLEGEAGRLAVARNEAERGRREAREKLEGAQTVLQRITREADWLAAAVERQAAELDAVRQQSTALDEALCVAEAAEREATQLLHQLEAETAQHEAADARTRLTEATSNVSQAFQALAAVQAQVQVARAQWKSSQERREAALRRRETIVAEIAEARRLVADLEVSIADQEARLAERKADMAAAEGERAAVQARLQSARNAQAEAEQALRASEAAAAELRLSLARAEDRLVRLYDQLRADAEWLRLPEGLPEVLDPASAPQLALSPVPSLPEDIEEHIRRLRNELRAIGAIDREALREYEVTAERYQGLSVQRADLEAAIRDLQQLLTGLEDDMRQRFDVTLAAVARTFRETFVQLFGGGEAELAAVPGEEGQPGIEIIARPPGKRRQSLALLSGGERALTAVALLFALLRVSGTPFVVLDEVDAALDEANIDRFGQALEALAKETQVIIISHNRGTIGRAGAVYGVTMAEDGSSQVISLRLEVEA